MVDKQIGNYTPVLWEQVACGDSVWLRGTHDGCSVVYGPHTVADVSGRKLQGSRGRFTHWSEDLMRRRRRRWMQQNTF